MTELITVTVKIAAELTSLSEDVIRAAVYRQELPAKNAGRRILIKVEDLRQWIDDLPEARP